MVRPTSLTILAWTTVVFGIMSCVSIGAIQEPSTRELYALMGIPLRWVIWSSLFGGIVFITAGVGLLRARSWARPLLVVYFLVTLVSAFLLMGDEALLMFVPSSIFYLVALAVLYHPSTSDYLEGVYEPDTALRDAVMRHRRAEGNRSDLLRVFGVIVLVGAGILLSMILLMDSLLASLPGGSVVAGAMALPFMIALAAGMVMWGWRRWMITLGWVLAGGAGAGVVEAIMMWLIFRSDWMEVLAVEGGEMPAPGLGSAAFGIVLVAAGAVLLMVQYRRDRAAVVTAGDVPA